MENVPNNRYSYYLGLDELKRQHEIVFLAVIIDNRVTFHKQYDVTLGRSYGVLRFTKRSVKEFDNVWVKKASYWSFVHSTVEYAFVVWMPYCHTQIST